jgi:hypothetical protein
VYTFYLHIYGWHYQLLAGSAGSLNFVVVVVNDVVVILSSVVLDETETLPCFAQTHNKRRGEKKQRNLSKCGQITWQSIINDAPISLFK